MRNISYKIDLDHKKIDLINGFLSLIAFVFCFPQLNTSVTTIVTNLFPQLKNITILLCPCRRQTSLKVLEILKKYVNLDDCNKSANIISINLKDYLGSKQIKSTNYLL
jgi:hypothetical protein